jgi:PAS domain S-box-containing protein
MDLFYELVGLGIAIIDESNTVLVSTGWQDVCTKFHRIHPETCKRCNESDAFIAELQNENNPVEYKCKNGMWDIAIPIIIDGKILASVYFGQFFYDDEQIDFNFFEKQAEQFGFDKQVYLTALKNVPMVSHKKVETLISFYAKLAQIIADSGYQNLIIKREQIQERYFSQQKLIETTELLTSISDNVPATIGIFDQDFKYIYVNKNAERVFGKSVAEIIGKHPSEVIGKEAFERGYPYLAKSMKGENQVFENNYYLKDGSIEYVQNDFRPFFRNEKISGVLGISTNITQIKNKEFELKESEARFKNMFEKHSSVMLLIEPESGRIINANKAAADFYGSSIEDLCEKNINEINKIPPEQIAEEMSNAFKEKRNFFIFPHRLFSGEERIVEVHSSPIIYENHKILFSIIQDITERTIIEKALKRQEEELRKLNEDKNRFISIIGHDLKGPINSIRGLLEMVTPNYREYSIEETEEFTKMIYSSIQNTSILLEDILIWARTNSGRIPFEPEFINLGNVIEDIIESLQEVANDKAITLNFSIGKEINFYADSNMIKTIIRNLISNAIKFTNRNGTINLKAEINSQNVKITVSDNGIGISSNIKNKLFDLSQKITSVGTENETGTGLGLLLCKEFVKMHDGEIWVESEVNKGSNFIFTIPLKTE